MFIEKAECLGTDSDIFFEPHREEEAKIICSFCAVKTECLEYALKTHSDEGVWGGYNGKERKGIRRRRRRAGTL